jgi:hypothetical protein
MRMDILISWFLAAVLEIYTQHFTRRLHFTQQYQGSRGLLFSFTRYCIETLGIHG